MTQAFICKCTSLFPFYCDYQAINFLHLCLANKFRYYLGKVVYLYTRASYTYSFTLSKTCHTIYICMCVCAKGPLKYRHRIVHRFKTHYNYHVKYNALSAYLMSTTTCFHSNRSGHRHSTSLTDADANAGSIDDDDVEDDIDDEQFFLERQMCRMERQNRRSKRR